MAMLATLSKSARGIAKVDPRMASPLSLRKSAMVLKPGARCPVSLTSSILRWRR